MKTPLLAAMRISLVAAMSSPVVFSRAASPPCPPWPPGAHALAGGLADMGVVHQPIDGGRGQGLGHELVESRRVEVEEIATERFS